MGALDGWTFCPRCREELTPGAGRLDCPACGLAVYANPAPTACAVCEDEAGRVLLVRRAGGVYDGYWDLPGGFVDEAEHPVDCVVRELREETGLEVEPLGLLGIWMDRYSEDDSGPGTLNLYWRARVLGGRPAAADDVSELRWFAVDDLPPPEQLAFRNVAEALSAWRQARA
jgi:8-oxo-dGTP diphosphatase